MVLIDGDAYGLDIASVYKFGSHALKHEAHKLVAERVECIGLWASELDTYGIDADSMLPISTADREKAQAMLRRPLSVLPVRWRQELAAMLHTQRKAEIEILVKTTQVDKLGSHDVPRLHDDIHPLLNYLSLKITAQVSSLNYAES